MSRYTIYVGASTLLANAVLFRAYYERPNFYSAAVYISQSNGSVMLLVNLALICCLSFGYGLQRLLYGPLRPIETEQLYDKAWFAVSETLLAMTIFRDDIGFSFFVMFLCLLGGKVWQWIGEGRVEFLEQQPPANPRLFHSRLSVSLLLSVVFDIFMVQYCLDAILREARPGMMVMFAFEYVLLAIVSVSTLLRYVLSLVEMLVIHRQTKARDESRRLATEEAQRQAQAGADGQAGTAADAPAAVDEDDEDDEDVPGWEEKGRWVFYLDLTTDFIKSVVYCGFFTILIAFHGIPIHIMRDLFFTIRSFLKRIHDFVQYRNATKDMNSRYPDATVEQLANENTCIVCREEMRPWVEPGAEGARPGRRMDERQRPKKLPCGHILHFGCLRSWLERQQVCPTCRRPVLADANTPRAPQANQGNAGAQGNQAQQNPPNDLQNLLNRLGGRPANQPQNGQNGQPGGQIIRANNVRTWNLGPFRLVIGNVAVPPAANNAQNRPPTQQHNAPLNALLHQGQPINGMLGVNNGDVQTDILRIQENIINSIRQLHAQHGQLEQLQALLAQLNSLQQANGGPANVQLPNIQPLNANWGPAGAQRAYLPVEGQAAMGPGHSDLPEGLTLPPGYTLRRMAPVPTPTEVPSTLSSAPAPQRAPSDHIRRALYPEAHQNNNPQISQGSRAPSPGVSGSTQNNVSPSTTANADGPAQGTHPGFVPSGWSFGDTSAASAQAEGSSSSSTQSAPRQATVEDSEDRNE
ncbi:hypothetical protein BU16DRAFT_522370 [Lophium mytilinum]|uniref:RING-type E3 ubiquitin transferase n=1 Tax=Lophium mytilinum TaxID=390894 RepID=A0A6A6RAL7_9PEZI|nr:hypothetical protein BU16DRAFT_522370 [Lophium mytilinum]